MHQRLLTGVVATLVCLMAPPALSDEGGASDDGKWATKTDLTMNVRAFGYAPADIVSLDGDVRVKGKELLRHRGDFRFRLFIHGKYLHLEAFPYTVVPEPEGGGYKVSLAGLELNLLAVVREGIRVGLYHHSAHNFSLEDHGNGIDLNALVVDIELWRGEVPYVGGKFLLREVFHYYATDKGSPYVFTEDTDIDAAKIGNIKWRATTEIGMVGDADWRSACSLSLAATATSVASSVIECDALFTPGDTFFGVLGDHVAVGPFVRYGQNIQRTKRFGDNAVMGGVRIRLIASETHKDLKFR